MIELQDSTNVMQLEGKFCSLDWEFIYDCCRRCGISRECLQYTGNVITIEHGNVHRVRAMLKEYGWYSRMEEHTREERFLRRCLERRLRVRGSGSGDSTAKAA
jgi:hypothetical protein